MENPGYQDSPLTSTRDYVQINSDEHDCSISEDIEKININDEEKQQSNDNFQEDCSSPITSVISTDDKPSLVQNSDKKVQRRRKWSKNKQSMLKQALFKPYVDEIPTEAQVVCHQTNGEGKRTPLASKQNDLLFGNENVVTSNEKLMIKKDFTRINGKNAVKKSLTLKYISDKENIQVP